MRKAIILLLGLIICVSLFAGGQKKDGQDLAGPVSVSPPGQVPIVDEKITITAFSPSIGWVADWDTNAAMVWMENASNIHIEWTESSKVDAKNKLSILIASGEYPGIVFGAGSAGLSSSDTFRYGTQGIFLPLNDLIDKHGFYIKDMFESETYVKSAITSPDGKIYSLPVVATDDYHMTMRQKFWINQVWLDNLGLKAPTTTDEFYTVMKAFKEQDANGNGDPDDEIPMSGAKREKEDLAMWIMNAFIVAGGTDDSGDQTLNGYEFIVDNKVIFNANKDEFREGLYFIRKLYTEGLIDVAALSQDKEQIKPLVDGGEVSRIGGATSHHPGNFASMAAGENARYTDYVALPPIRGPKGQQNTPWFIDAIIDPGQFVITDRCGNPEAAFKWADYMFSEEYGINLKGTKGVHWDYADPEKGLIGLNGKPAVFVNLKPPTMEDNVHFVFGPGWTRDTKNEAAKGEGYSYEEFLYLATKLYDPYKVQRFPYKVAPIAAADMVDFDNLRKTIHGFVGESVDRFIIGDLSLDNGWENYKKQLDQIGLNRYLEILNAAYKNN